MDRGKAGTGRGSKKITPHPSEFIVLGSKNTRDPIDNKRPNIVISKASSSSSLISNDRKKEGSSLPALIPSKKPKLASHATNPTIRPSDATVKEIWELLAVDIDPADFVPSVMDACESEDNDRIVKLICGALKILKASRYTPDKIICLGLLYLVKIKPNIFCNENITTGFAALFKKDPNFKKGNPVIPVVISNVIMHGFNDKRDWPKDFIRIFIEDAIGERLWVDNEECKSFVDNILTAFNTREPPKSVLQPEVGILTQKECPSPSTPMEDDNGSSLSQILGDKEKSDSSVIPRFANIQDFVEKTVVEIVKERLARSQPDTINRNLLKLLSSTCGIAEIRLIAVSKLENWLHNPKLMRSAQELLLYVCYNCTTHTQKDMEVINQLVKIRLKTKAVINLYINGVKELISLHPENLSTLFRSTIYNELSVGNNRNPNNMHMLQVMFANAPEASAQLLGKLFQDLLLSREDYLRPLRVLFREIARVCRNDLILLVVARTLMSARLEIIQQLPVFEFKERMFHSIIDLLCLCMFLCITPQVKEAVILTQRGDKKEASVLHNFQNSVATIQYETIAWIQCSASQMFGINKKSDFHQSLLKILLLESQEQYHKLDGFPPESERPFYMRMVSEVPVLEQTIMKLIYIGVAEENPMTHAEILDIIDQIIRRSSMHSSEMFPLLHIEKPDIVECIFSLCMYSPRTVSPTIPADYIPPTLAIANLYWRGWLMLLMIVAHNPATIGKIMWKHYPMLDVLIEMCITNHFSYPPPTMASSEGIDQERTKELHLAALEKQEIIQYETHLAGKGPVTESASYLLPQTMFYEPQGMPRRPPQLVLDQIQSLNTTHRLRELLCRSRNPDFLLDIIHKQQSSSSQNMPWLAELVQNNEGSLSQLPVQCLCEYLLSSSIMHSDKQSRQKQLLAHLQQLLIDPLHDSQHSYEVLEYFMRKLSSSVSKSRMQAIKALKLILDDISMDDEVMIVDGDLDYYKNESWLLQKLPSIPHFLTVRSLVAKALRGACNVEYNPDLVQAYIIYLAAHTQGDDLVDFTHAVNEISQLVVERNTIFAAILPQTDTDNPRAKQTLRALMSLYCNYLNKARALRQDNSRVTWSESQDLILVEWATGEECTMHILVVHAMIILLTYDQLKEDPLFQQLLETWFPENHEPPKAYLIDTSEEALLIPDWLKLRIIRSNLPRLVDAALRDLEPYQLVLFIQSFGVPVNAMTKLLCLLDEAIQKNPGAVTQNVLDKMYMTGLVKILHNRGASGGLIFLEHIHIGTPPAPEESLKPIKKQLEQLPVASMLQKQASVQLGSIKTEVPSLINQLFIENIPMSQKNEVYRKLSKMLAKDQHKLGTEKERGAIVVAIKHILSVLSSFQVKDFLSSLAHMSQYSCTLMRLILHPLKRHITCTKVIELARSMCLNLISMYGDIQAPVISVLRDFVSINVPQTKYQDKLKFTEEPSKILETADLQELECVGSKLLDVCMEKNRNDVLIQSITNLLIADNEQCMIKPRTGLLIDWLASMEPELIGTCPNLQIRLLFGKTNVFVRIDESIVSSHSCRPYLLTLLTHGASWATLQKCVDHLLTQCHQEYDPTAVLDFLWSLTCNPKLWQGREKYSTKNDLPENILLLTSDQLLSLAKYVVEEAVILCNRQSRKTAVSQMESRLDLLICCFSGKEELTMSIVKYLAGEMTNHNDTYADVSHQFLLHMYMKIPKIITYLSTYQTKRLSQNACIAEWTGSVLDCMSHSLLTSLAAIPRQKSYGVKSRELELCVRKMAAVHPLLVLRQLPLLSTSLMGWNDLEFGQFRSSHHLSLFNQVMGLLELLQPYLFEEEHQRGLEATLDNYCRCFRNFCTIDDLTTLLNRFAQLLHAYIQHAERRALKFIQKHIYLLQDLQAHYLGLESLRSLVHGIHVPREGENSDHLLITVGFRHAPSPPPAVLPDIIVKLTKIQGEEVLSSLQEIEHWSSRKPAILEPVIDNIAELLVSPQTNIRSLSHQLLARALKNKPHPHLGILASLQKCLDSSRADILASALDKLPDYILCMQEYALPLLQRVFELGVNSNVNTIPHINKSVTLLNIQRGC
ncbi:integrator complex subunit 1 [Trichogramma pretiosum]|uniref:integrator complex subunit 1 n=1 Tax=Trichogramma pretiosum TaxID=7493 RepID=UPI0006C96912|nr:integrator complex subunit 1 [Trichogramma pretiosum]XP_014230548.1 integrator complex subunit 1 [Trichogramma pretiosum]